ncbi:hypothetical protein OS493_016949 [Desmophyllum pertusum]|uniref:Uncharacterized protein n=1 Tax=Desmophyllum pertusum TaxID=174260 RepID=A0A9W9YNP8_9CNID|nr:hypothetical protein OS493_016949 [Desmophyllum pertusum]
MSHRESTAEKYYRVFDKNKSSVKASQTLHGMMRNTKSKSPIVREEESEEGVDKFAENKDVQEDPKRVYDKVRAEWRYKGNTDSSMELTKLPEETETVNHRVDRMFASNNENMADNSSSHSTDFVSATDTTVKSKGLFSNSQAKVLVELFPDMVNDGKPISKPVIIKRLSECSKGDLFKDYNVVQVVNIIKYERRQKREREQSRKVGVNKLT